MVADPKDEIEQLSYGIVADLSPHNDIPNSQDNT
jgi:hypothetical protein